MRTLAIRLPGKADEAVRRVALAVDQVLVTETPVRSGRARSNWLVSFDSPSSGQRPTLGPDGSAALAEGQSKISTYRSGIHRSIHITNNLPYINRLNQGWSAQAPAGYVEAAVMAGVSQLVGVSLL